jgi:hypothetical protein
VTKAQLAIVPDQDSRQAERRIVNLAARLREIGAAMADAEIQNLSTDGFMAETEAAIAPGAQVWLKLQGIEPQKARVVWAEEGKAGCEFETPLHPATLELLVALSRKPPVKRHFGPQT